MAGLGPAIHVFAAQLKKGMDARDKPGHYDARKKQPHPLRCAAPASTVTTVPLT
jgi:hypothetical protein